MSQSKPDFTLHGLSIRVRGRQFPEHSDFFDGNWLIADVVMEASGSTVWSTGPFLRNTDFAEFRDELVQLHSNLSGKAELRPLEPDLKIVLTAGSLGHLAVVIDISPDHIEQAHRYEFGLDQSYIPGMIQQCDLLLQRFPVIGTP